MKTLSNLFNSALIAATFLSASGIFQNTAQAHEGGSGPGGVPNPASVFCAKFGENIGTSEDYEHVRYGLTSFTLCKIGDAMIEEWTLWRGVRGSEEAVQTFLSHPEVNIANSSQAIGVPNPAAVYCEGVGGGLQSVYTAEGNTISVCKFSDNSKIEAWTLFRGPRHKSNKKLVKVLTKRISE